MKTQSTADALWSTYTQLANPARLILQLKSLAWPVRTQTPFMNALNATGSLDPASGKPWRLSTLKSFCEHLAKKGLLNSQLELVFPLLHRVAIDAMAGKQSKLLHHSIKANFPAGRLTMVWAAPHRDISFIHQLRLALYANDLQEFKQRIGIYTISLNNSDKSDEQHLFKQLFFQETLDMSWLASRAPLMQCAIFTIYLDILFQGEGITPELKTLLEYFSKRRWEPGFEPLLEGLYQYDLLAGKLDELQKYAAYLDEKAEILCAESKREGDDFKSEKIAWEAPLIDVCSIAAFLHFLAGNHKEAITEYRKATKMLRKLKRSRKAILQPPHISAYLLALLHGNDPALFKEAQALLDIIHPRELYIKEDQFSGIQSLLWFAQGMANKAKQRISIALECPTDSPLDEACIILAAGIIDLALLKEMNAELKERFQALETSFPLLARIYAEVLERNTAKPEPYTKFLSEACGGKKTIRFLSIVEQRDSWERVLEGLNGLLRPSGTPATRKKRSGKRLAWMLDPDEMELQVVEQTSKPRQGWTSGRALSLKRLFMRDPKLPLSEHDNKVLPALRRGYSYWGWRKTETFSFDLAKALPLLAGHPLVFDARNPRQRIELIVHQVELVIREEPKGYRMSLSHMQGEEGVLLEEETPSRYRIIEFTPQHVKLEALLGEKGLFVPPKGRERVLELVDDEDLQLPVRAELSGIDAEIQEGLTTPVLQLQPLGQGLKVTLAVRPLGKDGPCFVPGMGTQAVLANMDGESRRARRDFEQELQASKRVLQSCPTLQRLGGQREWDIDDIESSLDLLLELQACPHPVELEWPAGVSYMVSPPVKSSSMSLSLRKSRGWFQIDGTVRVDESQVVNIQDLLKNIDNTVGQFVPLGEGRFLALTREFQRQLSRLALLSEPSKTGRAVHPLGAAALLDVVETAGKVDADQAWDELAERIRRAGEHVPKIPSTLQAQLRDYQLDGFTWLSRLAHWGAGACLADDMGLGKTLQTIAAMLEQASKGPCLVVAPTSVCHNWEDEITRFAPTLTPYRLAGDRETLINSLGPGDVLIASYGLMNTSSDLLAGRVWQVAVFDEAQAIKNTQTRRAQASRKIEAAFRVALTGTPIENYLDELWSLFNTINPGLLGSRDSFRRRFSIPIERDQDKNARQTLKALLRPFILRRTKSAVLSELPPRTELNIDIELPDAERSFYEALRRQALESLSSLESQAPGQRKIHILAELTRLRRACCHPGLVDPDSTLSSAKLDTFMELVSELQRSNHKALVFSQFVGYLQRVRQALDQAGVRYQYLDGSTPANERQRAVAAFQAGEGDLFLISLRAGGTGLNLTAADYVFHLDPWWNPAVEDQASDRAHRIGQSRPVTVYRLIVKDSVEEKILRLHREKRDLAADLLEGTDTGVRLGEEELLALLQA